MPAGTRQQETLRVLNTIEQKIPELNNEFKQNRKDGKDIVLSVSKTVEKTAHSGSLTIELLDGETRKTESSKITEAFRQLVGTIPGVESVNYGSRNMFGKPIVIALKGNDLTALTAAKAAIKKALGNYEKIKDIVDPSAVGAPEIDITFLNHISMFNLTPAAIMTQIRHGFYGLDVQDVQRGINEVAIRTEFNQSEKNSIEQLTALPIKTPQGNTIPLGSIATFQMKQGTQQITRTNGMRQLNLEANLANAKDPVPAIINEIQQTIIDPIMVGYPTVSAEFEGQNKEQAKMREIPCQQ